jgi:hypothetical protein
MIPSAREMYQCTLGYNWARFYSCKLTVRIKINTSRNPFQILFNVSEKQLLLNEML